jgi:NAD(P)-dependent dehydrogenase (short-subunit alcohol dehydrogenase family)
MTIEQKVFILTGASRIGKDVALELNKRGAKLALTYLTTKQDLGISDAIYIKADLSKIEDVKNVVEETKKQFGKIDGLIHMAAIYPKTPWTILSETDFDKTFGIIAKSAFLMSKSAADSMTEGKIILFSDWSVLTQPYKEYLAYNVAKSAVVGLTKSLAKELAPKISVNAIAPGPILKPADLSDEDNAEVMKNTPLERWGGSKEIVKAVMYLLDSDFTTGQVLFVDGGRSIV